MFLDGLEDTGAGIAVCVVVGVVDVIALISPAVTGIDEEVVVDVGCVECSVVVSDAVSVSDLVSLVGAGAGGAGFVTGGIGFVVDAAFGDSF